MATTFTWYVDNNVVGGLSDGTSWANADFNLEELYEGTNHTALGQNVAISYDSDVSYGVGSRIITLAGFEQRHILASLDDANDEYRIGAAERSSTVQYSFAPVSAEVGFTVAGLTMDAGTGAIVLTSGINAHAVVTYRDCTFDSDGSLTPHGGDGAFVKLLDCKRLAGASTARIHCGFGGYLYIDNLQAEVGHTLVDDLLDSQGNGGFTAVIENTDLSAIIASGGGLCQSIGTSDDLTFIKLRRCKMPTSWTPFQSTPTTYTGFIVDIAECDDGSEYPYFLYIDGRTGQAELDTTQYLSDTYDGSTNFSVQIDTYDIFSSGNNPNPWAPFKYKLATIPGQDLSASQTVSVELSGPAGLTDLDVWIECVAPDATDQPLGVKHTTQTSNLNAASPTALTASSAVWNVTTATEYSIDCVIPALTGVTHGNVDVYVCVGKPAVSALNVAMPTIAAT